jgi:pyridoxal phosphate enzyme (YggS family)
MLDFILKRVEEKKALLVAVSKTKSVEQISAIYDKGLRNFGENRAQELAQKHSQLPNDIVWHMIGHLQKNKVKYIAEFVQYIQSVDSYELLKTINKEAKKYDRCIKILLQLKIAKEETKFGLSYSDARELIQKVQQGEFKNIEICGLMGMATFTDNEDQVRSEFQTLKKYFDLLKIEFFSSSESFKEISMGMSGDYPVALAEGATMVRIGSLIFGSRQ